MLVELTPSNFIDSDSIVAIEIQSEGYDVYVLNGSDSYVTKACEEFESCPIFDELKYIGSGINIRLGSVLEIDIRGGKTEISFKNGGGMILRTNIDPEMLARRIT